MTEQREFPFFVNGEYWKTVKVEEKIISQGFMLWVVCEKIRFTSYTDLTPTSSIMKHVRFQLAEVIENYGGSNYRARFFTGFWVCDKNIKMEGNALYLKEIK